MAAGGRAGVGRARAELLEAVRRPGLRRGAGASPGQRAEVERLVDALAAAAAAAAAAETDTGPRLTGAWRMAYTTERESLSILDKAGWFGTSAGEVYQIIDTAAGSLSNVITFPPVGAFVVDSTLAVADESRCTFRFTGARLKLPDNADGSARNLPFPPFGAGWFDNLFLDDELRVARDSRGDTLVVERADPLIYW